MSINTILLCAFSMLCIPPQQLCAMEIVPAAYPFSYLPQDIKKTICLSLFSEENQQIVAPIFEEALQNQSTNKALADLFFIAQAPDIETVYILQRLTHPRMALENIKKRENFHAVFKGFSEEKQKQILDHLYEKKYDPKQSPLWKSVKEISDEKDYKKRKDNLYEIYARIDTWSKEDPAAALYTQLIQSPYTENKTFQKSFELYYQSNQGLKVRLYYGDGGWNSEDHTTRRITETAHGHTELPLILALSHFKYNAPDRMDYGRDFYMQTSLHFEPLIKNIHDVDIEALKTVHKKSVHIEFENMAQDATISPHIADLGTKDAQTKIKIRNTTPNLLTENKDLQYGHYYTYSDYGRPIENDQYYILGDPHWMRNAITKICLTFGACYLIKKYIIDVCLGVYKTNNELIEHTKASAFNTEIKPILTPDTINALQVSAHYNQLPTLLSNEVGTLESPVTIQPEMLEHADAIIQKTNTLLSMHDSRVGDYIAGIPIGLSLASIGALFGTIINPVRALYASFFKPENLCLYVKPKLQIFVPKDNTHK